MREAKARISDAHIAEIRARTPLAPLVSRRVKLARSGKQWFGCCPFHSEKTPSFYIFADDHFHCFGCGVHGDAIDFVQMTQRTTWHEAVNILAAESGLNVMSEAPANTLRRDAKRDADDQAARARQIVRGVSIYREGKPDMIVRRYLESRGCGGFVPDVLLFHPACPRPADGGIGRLPAMLAPITDPASNVLVGCHCTYLRPDGAGKVENGKSKVMWGSWGVIRLTLDENVTLGLGLAEGIETALTIMQRAGWGAVWAAGCAGAIGKFPVLAGIECLTLFPDLDDRGAGRDAAKACADRWAAEGREVQTIFPPGGSDWNDALARWAA